MFEKQIYIQRRQYLKSQFQTGILLFLGNDDVGINYMDNTYHFRQDSTFLYYFGISRPGIFAIMDIYTGNDYIFGDDFTIDSIVWMGTQPTISELVYDVGIEMTGNMAQFAENIKNYPKNLVHYLPPYRAEHQVKLCQYLDIPIAETASGASIPFICAVSNQRIVKSEEEIAQIEHAVSITSAMHQTALRTAKPGMTEAAVAAKVYEVALSAGGNISFPTIATIQGQTLHNHYQGNVIKAGQLFLLDAGYETPMGYAGDMSSTFPVSGKFTQEQKIIYQITLDAHNSAIEMLKPGVHFMDVHLKVAAIIFEGLRDLGFTKGNTEDAVVNGAHALFFPCGTGHLMGLDVHDMENLGEEYVGYCGHPKSTQFGLKSLRLGRPLQQGFVLTIEPGIYFIPELIDLWYQNETNKTYINFDKVNSYRNFGGIRNEEDILITAHGSRILGNPLAKSIEEVEYERSFAFL